MTSTPVKNIPAPVGTVKLQASPENSKELSFETVWNRQSRRDDLNSEAARKDKNPAVLDEQSVRDPLKESNLRKDQTLESASADKVKKTVGAADSGKDLNPSDWEAAMEVLCTAAADLIRQIADSFGMQIQDVEALMESMGFDKLDLFCPEKLGQLLLAAGGAEDWTAFLTNEELCGQYRMLMEQASALLENCGNALQVAPEELLEDVVQRAKLSASAEQTEQSPYIEVTTAEEVPPQEKSQQSADGLHTGEALQSGENAADKVLGQEGRTPDGKTDGNAGEQGGRQTDSGKPENLLLQNLFTRQDQVQGGLSTESVSSWNSETVDIMKQIMDYMKIHVKTDVSNLEMQLHPANLGTLQIHVASKGGVITAQFLTQNETVKAALESQMVQLKESFAEQGVKVEVIEVAVQTHQFEQNLEQGRGRQQGEMTGRSRSRRIRIDDSHTQEETDETAAEGSKDRESAAGSGSIVDYTA